MKPFLNHCKYVTITWMYKKTIRLNVFNFAVFSASVPVILFSIKYVFILKSYNSLLRNPTKTNLVTN